MANSSSGSPAGFLSRSTDELCSHARATPLVEGLQILWVSRPSLFRRENIMNEGLGNQSDPGKEATKDREVTFGPAYHPLHMPLATMPL